ncbi:hypothetical protein ARMSODRAFT_807640 [Armillaria solidipes]|uniref:MFS general substrate transporter n=1 Tax=Armillaria solidipes TaxID=1076256 RepID=A0A2H3AQW2_9AGAR|nr:hypothetical protein ARMSODRAFT_807640 [Armillaria solidipes]
MLGFVHFMDDGTRLTPVVKSIPRPISTRIALCIRRLLLWDSSLGSVNNMLGPKVALLTGSTDYSLAASIHSSTGGFVVAIVAIYVGLLWTAQGSLMMAYPTESQKGRFIGIFWSIFNLGGVVGASVAAGRNWKSTADETIARMDDKGHIRPTEAAAAEIKVTQASS